MKKLIVMLVGLSLALAACVPTKPDAPLTVHQRYEAACVSAGASYAAIAAVNKVHTLTASQQAKVLVAVGLTDARCKLAPGKDYPYTATEAALAELEGAAGTLATIEEAIR
jgi:hypothetical protein